MFTEEILDASRLIRQAAEIIERQPRPAGSRQHAVLQLAWHHLMDASTLLIKGRLTPEDLVWATDAASAIDSREASETAQQARREPPERGLAAGTPEPEENAI